MLQRRASDPDEYIAQKQFLANSFVEQLCQSLGNSCPASGGNRKDSIWSVLNEFAAEEIDDMLPVGSSHEAASKGEYLDAQKLGDGASGDWSSVSSNFYAYTPEVRDEGDSAASFSATGQHALPKLGPKAGPAHRRPQSQSQHRLPKPGPESAPASAPGSLASWPAETSLCCVSGASEMSKLERTIEHLLRNDPDEEDIAWQEEKAELAKAFLCEARTHQQAKPLSAAVVLAASQADAASERGV